MSIHVHIVKETELAKVESDLIVIALFEHSSLSASYFDQLNAACDNQLAYILKDEQHLSKFKSTTFVHTLGQIKAKQILFVGAGEQEKYSHEKVRELAGRVTREALKNHKSSIVFCVESFITDKVGMEKAVHALTEGSLLATHRVQHYKSSSREGAQLDQLAFYSSEEIEGLDVHIETAKAFAEGTMLARDLVNVPANLLTPTKLAEKALEIAEAHQLECHILDREEMEKLGMGALLAVAQGSEEPPKMIVLKYQGLDKWENVLSFVGKGITFDTGGISLKTPANMDEMKGDMGGSATVLGVMEVVGRLKPKCNVLAVIPSTENMPSGKALKPGDVITSMSGKTIEVKNTDAEGRLILADGVTYAKQLGANYIVDVATLTGAVLIALGDCTTGAVTNHEDFMIEVLESAEEASEWVWRLPNYPAYKEMVKSSAVADLNNAPGRLAGSITAGLFIGEFAEETPWVHLDIAGTAWSGKENDLCRKGGTGAMVRTLSTLVERFQK